MTAGDDQASTVEQSGDATASDGAVANSGILNGSITINNFRQLLLPPAAPPADPLPKIRERCRDYAKAELATLVDWGQIRVPWHRIDPTAGTCPSSDTETDLAQHIASGGKLVVIGDSQSGKTTLAYTLVDLLDRLAIPSVILRMRSWTPQRQRLEVWISSVLRDEYGLHGDEHQAAIKELHEGRIVPIFDGFDEVGPGDQVVASQALRLFTSQRRAVLTGIRTLDNQAAFAAAIPDAETISLGPVAPDEVKRFLLLRVPSTAGSTWHSFTGELLTERGATVLAALSSPLNAWLVKTIYAADDPLNGNVADLLDLGTPADVERHLHERTVNAVFVRSAAQPGGAAAPSEGFLPEEAEFWLGFLASRRGSRAIAFWQIRHYAPTYRMALIAVAVLGAGAALLSGTWFTPPAAVALFLLMGVTFGFGYARGYSTGRWLAPDDPTRLGYLLQRPTFEPGTRRRRAPTDGDLRDHAYKLLMGSVLVAVCYLVTEAVWWASQGHSDWWLGLTKVPFLAWLAVAVGPAPAIGYVGGRFSARVLRLMPKVDAATGARTADPLKVIHNDRRSGVGMVVLACINLTCGYLLAVPIVDLPGGMRGLVAMPVGAAAAIFFWNQWAPFRVAHIWLSLRNRLPWDFARFLSACHEAGLLRQNGNHFIFRHDALRECLAVMYRRRTGTPAS
ncbi:hypothetical protein [Actinoplanes subglobosus]|uniref:NACHT domain-containing protein n=1 Tax=Actinoplanes subglobosus TaxID=1547892 RepID=A0ABV8IPX7_9ACTN